MQNDNIPSEVEGGTGCRTLIRVGLICLVVVVMIVLSGTYFFGEKGSYYVFLFIFFVLLLFFIGYYIKLRKGGSAGSQK
jgi:hypothetical protein